MLSDVYFPRVNGVSTSIQTFAMAFVAQGHEVTLIAPDYGEETEQPFEVIRISSRYLPIDPEDRILKYRHIMALSDELKKRAFDLLHIHTPFVAHYAGIKLARRLAIPVVETYHTFFEEYLYNYVKFLPRSWLRAVARRFSASQCNDVDKLMVPSRAMLDVLRGYGVQVPATVIPTGIEAALFQEGNGARFRHQYGIDAERPVMVHVGRVAHEKNICFLLQVLHAVAQRIPDILLLIAGEGPARKELETTAQALGLAENLAFVGYLKRDGELQDCYCAGDIFVFASRTETQGLVLLEAMALGVPVVSTAVMGTKEVLAHGKGALVAEENLEDFTTKVMSLLDNPHDRQTLGLAAKDYALGWSAPALAERMLSGYESLSVGLAAA
jgi:glycosyltransferase involved in cell wall biosynthesis